MSPTTKATRSGFHRYKVPPISAAWLAERIGDHRVPQRRIAEAIEMDPPALSRALAGRRRLTLREFDLIERTLEAYCPAAPGPAARALRMARMPRAEVSRLTGIPEARLLDIAMGHGDRATGQEARALSVFDPDSDITDEVGISGGKVVARDGTIPVLAAPVPQGEGRYGPFGPEVDRVAAPTKLANANAAFAFYVPDDGLAPRYLRGELLYVQPGRAPQPDRWGVVIAESGCTFGRLVAGGGRGAGDGIMTPNGTVIALGALPGRMARIAGSWID